VNPISRSSRISYIGGVTCTAAGAVKLTFGSHYLLGAALIIAGVALIVVTVLLDRRRKALERAGQA
jgi:hypothetical protein